MQRLAPNHFDPRSGAGSYCCGAGAAFLTTELDNDKYEGTHIGVAVRQLKDLEALAASEKEAAKRNGRLGGGNQSFESLENLMSEGLKQKKNAFCYDSRGLSSANTQAALSSVVEKCKRQLGGQDEQLKEDATSGSTVLHQLDAKLKDAKHVLHKVHAARKKFACDGG